MSTSLPPSSSETPAGPRARVATAASRFVLPLSLSLSLAFAAASPLPASRAGDAGPAPDTAPEPAPARVASRATSASPDRVLADHAATRRTSASPVVDTTLADTVTAATKAIAACQQRYARVDDYTCVFVKRERHNGTLSSPSIMHMKARSRPHSIYMRFAAPNKGREAIYVKGRHKDQVVAHDVGLFKVIAGTVLLDPRGPRAMEGCRHPITEAGIGALIDTIAHHWGLELTSSESKVSIHPGMAIGARPCTMIETVHPTKQPHFLFHKVKLYIDHEHGLPVRFEAYDWPARPGAPEPLVEEYVYVDLKLNVGLTERDFDPDNPSYAFGRF